MAASSHVLTLVKSVKATGKKEVTVEFFKPVKITFYKLPTSWFFGFGNHMITKIIRAPGTSYVFEVEGEIAPGEPYLICSMDLAAKMETGEYVAADTGVMG